MNLVAVRKRLLVVGATGDVGRAAADALSQRHDVLRASRRASEPALRVDIADPRSVRSLYARIGLVDGVISCAGDARYGALSDLSEEDLDYSIANKLMGQINLVRLGVDSVRDGGVFVLTSGLYGTNPAPGVSALALVNGALDSFARAAALDLPRGIRINTVSPPYLKETARRLGGVGAISAAENAMAYVALVDGRESGQAVLPLAA